MTEENFKKYESRIAKEAVAVGGLVLLAGWTPLLLSNGCGKEERTMGLNEANRPEYHATAVIHHSKDPMKRQDKLCVYDHDGDLIADEATIAYGWTPMGLNFGSVSVDKWDHFVAEGLPYEKRFIKTDPKNTTTMPPEFRKKLSAILEMRKLNKGSLRPRQRRGHP